MNSNDKLTISIRRLQPFKALNFDENPSKKFLIIFTIIISSTFLINLIVVLISWIVDNCKNKKE